MFNPVVTVAHEGHVADSLGASLKFSFNLLAQGGVVAHAVHQELLVLVKLPVKVCSHRVIDFPYFFGERLIDTSKPGVLFLLLRSRTKVFIF